MSELKLRHPESISEKLDAKPSRMGAYDPAGCYTSVRSRIESTCTAMRGSQPVTQEIAERVLPMAKLVIRNRADVALECTAAETRALREDMPRQIESATSETPLRSFASVDY